MHHIIHILLFIFAVPHFAIAQQKIKLTESNGQTLSWPVSVKPQWQIVDDHLNFSWKLAIQIPTNITLVQGQNSDASIRNGVLQVFLKQTKSSLSLVSTTGVPQTVAIEVVPMNQPLLVDASCRTLGLQFKRQVFKPTPYFAAAKCSIKPDHLKLYIATAEDAEWIDGSLFETLGKGESWKTYELPAKNGVLVKNGFQGKFIWGNSTSPIEYQLNYTSPNLSKTVDEAKKESPLTGEAGLSVLSLTMKRTSESAPAVSGMGLAAKLNYDLRFWGFQIYSDLQMMAFSFSSTNTATFNRAAPGLTRPIHINRFSVRPQISYQLFNANSNTLNLSVATQGVGAGLEFKQEWSPTSASGLSAHYTPVSQDGISGSLLVAKLEHSFTVAAKRFFVATEYDQLQITTKTDDKIQTDVVMLSGGWQF